MSKGSLFWANASGKLGEAVFYRSGGEQRNRTYVRHIKNPKTESQMKNRIQLSNWAAMYRRLKPVLAKTFTNRSNAESGFNALVRSNKSRLRYAIDKSMLEKCSYIPVGARVSSGSIVCNIEPKQVALSDPNASGTPPKYYTQLLSLNETQLTFPTAMEALGYLRGKDIYAMMTANGNPMQLPSEFKVVILYGSVDIADQEGKAAEGGMPLSYRVYTCNATDETTGVFVGNELLAYNTNLRAVVSSVEQSEDGQSKIVQASGLMIGGDLTKTYSRSDCFGMVIYYENASGKNANNAFIYAYEGAISAAQDFAEGGDVFADILANSGYSASDALSGSASIRPVILTEYEIAQVEDTPSDPGEEEP